MLQADYQDNNDWSRQYSPIYGNCYVFSLDKDFAGEKEPFGALTITVDFDKAYPTIPGKLEYESDEGSYYGRRKKRDASDYYTDDDYKGDDDDDSYEYGYDEYDYDSSADHEFEVDRERDYYDTYDTALNSSATDSKHKSPPQVMFSCVYKALDKLALKWKSTYLCSDIKLIEIFLPYCA